jgi:hypothetical protein
MRSVVSKDAELDFAASADAVEYRELGGAAYALKSTSTAS